MATPKNAIRKSTWFGILKRSILKFRDDQCSDRAAALTYYGILAIFPGLIVVIALIGLVTEGPQAVDTILDIGRRILPSDAVQNLEDPVRDVVDQSTSAGTLVSFGLLGALWSASGYIGAFTRAANTIYQVEEGRPFYKLRPLQIGLTLVLLLVLAVITAGLVVSGPVARAIGETIGVGNTVLTVWQIGKWPVLLILASLLLAALYWFAPNVRQSRFHWFTIGGTVALLVWVLGSLAFGVYVSNFGSYNSTYGSLGAIIVFLIWLYLGNSALLLGAEINAELERVRATRLALPT